MPDMDADDADYVYSMQQKGADIAILDLGKTSTAGLIQALDLWSGEASLEDKKTVKSVATSHAQMVARGLHTIAQEDTDSTLDTILVRKVLICDELIDRIKNVTETEKAKIFFEVANFLSGRVSIPDIRKDMLRERLWEGVTPEILTGPGLVLAITTFPQLNDEQRTNCFKLLEKKSEITSQNMAILKEIFGRYLGSNGESAGNTILREFYNTFIDFGGNPAS